MIAEHEAVVAARFDCALRAGSSGVAARTMPRLRAIVERLAAAGGPARPRPGCGKGRFARALVERGAAVVGLDLSAGMLAEAAGLSIGCARRPGGCRLAAASFDAVMAVEVFEHLAAEVARSRLRRSSPGAQAGGHAGRRRQERRARGMPGGPGCRAWR